MNGEETATRLHDELGFHEGVLLEYARAGARCDYCKRDLIGERPG